jgi:2Fe-2S ferredoxin
MDENIQITVIKKGVEKDFEVPNNVGLNLMEFLKAAEHPEIEGMCGGMALCATCHIKVLDGSSLLDELNDDEAATLETLPQVFENSRLSCQIKLNEKIKTLKIEIV